MVAKLIKNKLLQHECGYWINPGGKEPISYPEQGNEFFADIEEKSFWFKHRNRIIISGVKNHPLRRMIFDIGGGNGFVARGLIDAGFEIEYITYFFRFLPPAIFLFGDKKKVSAETGNKSQYVRRGFSERLLNKLLDRELRYVELKKRINFGGSCFIAARSVKDQF